MEAVRGKGMPGYVKDLMVLDTILSKKTHGFAAALFAGGWRRRKRIRVRSRGMGLLWDARANWWSVHHIGASYHDEFRGVK